MEEMAARRLWHAAKDGRTDIVEVLLDIGAEVGWLCDNEPLTSNTMSIILHGF